MAVIPPRNDPANRKSHRGIVHNYSYADGNMLCNHGCNHDAPKTARRRVDARFFGFCGRSGPDLISS
jgi:hypothetical protein